MDQVVPRDIYLGDEIPSSKEVIPHVTYRGDDMPPNKKVKIDAEVEISTEMPLPTPSIPVYGFDFDTTKGKMVSSWVWSNRNNARTAGCATVVPYIPADPPVYVKGLADFCWEERAKKKAERLGIPITTESDVVRDKKLDLICASKVSSLLNHGTWDTEDIDAFLQLLNMQVEAYPEMFPSPNWTCLGSLYCSAIGKWTLKLIGNRQMEDTIDTDLSMVVKGIHGKWASKSWDKCDYVYGIDIVLCSQLVSYSYDFGKKVVNVYDPMVGTLRLAKKELFKRHAVVAPRLYNLCNGHHIFDPDERFTVKFIAVPHLVYLASPKRTATSEIPNQKIVGIPQHPVADSADCGIVCCKFVQLLTMEEDLQTLVAGKIREYRRKAVIDLLKWYKLPDGNLVLRNIDIKF